MSNTPKLSIGFSNGNLLKYIPSIDGIGTMIGTGITNGNLNKVFSINSLADAELQGITIGAEPVAHRHLSEFYTDLGGKQQLYLLLLPAAVTMAQMLDINDETHANLLLKASNGLEGYIAVFRSPAGGYAPGADFMDADVAAAVAAAKTFVAGQNAKLKFFRVLIEGRVNDETQPVIYAPNAAANGFAGVVLGGTLNDHSASVGLALARKLKYACHIKLGKVANGPLSAPQIYIGSKTLDQVANLDTLHGLGYISFVTYPGKAGFFFGIDNMASNDDYKILAHGATVDAAAKVARAVYIDDLEGEVDTNPNGTITEESAKHLEDTIEQQVKVSLGDRISGFRALVDRTSNIINTSTTNISLSVLPKGYNTWINVTIGLTAIL